MRIALLAPLWKRIPPDKYGGAELVVANLAKGFSDSGHKVTIFACAESKVKGRLIPVIDKPMYDLVGGFDWSGIKQYEFLSFFELGQMINEFDVVHNHMGIHPIALAPYINIPLVTTLHSSLPPDFDCLARTFRRCPFVSISNAQRRLAPQLNYIATVYHGIDIKEFKPNFIYPDKNNFVFIGTLSKNKGIDIAIRCARFLDANLTIAGEIRESDRAFLNKEVFPYVDGKKIKFIGEINCNQKAILLAESSALLFPSRWNEAFGLVMVESLACGTPVVALNNGAIREVIDNGRTGIIASSENDFFDAARSIGGLSRQECRLEATRRFNIHAMASGYIEAFKLLIKKNENENSDRFSSYESGSAAKVWRHRDHCK